MAEQQRTLLASVIVPAYNAERTISPCLEAILQQSIPQDHYEVIVVDDESSDGTTAVAERYPVRVIGQSHGGPAAARNLGAQMARAPLLVFTDADCAPTVNWLEALLRALEDPEVMGAKGTYKTSQRGLIARFVQVEYEEKYRRMARQTTIDFIDTYSAAYRRAVFLAYGGFDTLFTVPSAEDQEFSFRLAEGGHKLLFAPEAVVYHTHPDSWRWYFNRKVRFGFWQTINRWKHPKKILRDSYTPESQKVQLSAVALLPYAVILGALDARWWWSVAGCFTVFGVSTFSFMRLALALDPPVASIAPALLALRAVGVLAGLVGGSIVFPLKWLLRRRTVRTETPVK